MTFKPGKRTLRNLEGVHPDLQALVALVFARTAIDFCVVDGGGMRTKAQAQAYTKAGTGVLKSRHLTGDAVDFVPYVNGKPSWGLDHCKELMLVVYDCATELNFHFIHGADWNANGILGEPGTKEWDWPHIQRPYWYQKRKAQKAHLRRKAELEAPDTDRNPNDRC